MPPITTLGTKLYISAGIPATYDQTGYEALTFTQIKKVSSVGEFGRTYNVVTSTSLEDGETLQGKGSYTRAQIPIEGTEVKGDAGQLLLETASNSTANYSIKIEDQDGTVNYIEAQVTSFVTTRAVDSYIAFTSGLLQQTDAVTV